MALNDADIDETMADDWKAIQEKYAVEEEVFPPEESTNEVDSSSTADRARDAGGKFVSKETTDRSAKTDDRSASQKEKAGDGKVAAGKDATRPGKGNDGDVPGTSDPIRQQPEQAAELARDINRPPSSWKAAERALWDKVDPALRAAIHRRESEMAAGAQQLLPDAQFGKGLRQVIDPYRMLIEAEGGTPERAVASLLKTAAIFRVGTPEQKLQAVAGIARQYGVDLRPLFQPAQPGQQPQAIHDPRMDQFLANQQHQAAERQRFEQMDMERTVNGWMNEVDAQGNPTRPYIGEVFNEMSALIPQIREANPALTNAQALEEAYTRAIWANPEIRALLQQQAAAASSAQRQADNQTRLRDVRRAASVNVPRRASVPSAGKPGKMEDTIAETARELGLIST